MEPAIVRGLNDKLYDKRKAAALDLEKLVRECHASGDSHRINTIIDQLIDLFSSTTNPLHARNGGLIGLAAAAIALGVEVAVYMDKFIGPLLRCFDDSESRVRYFACESMYNIAKVSKGEILVYFNPIFDRLSRLAADSEMSVKNGAELLDRLLKDIVAESAPVYFPQFPETEKARLKQDEAHEPKHQGVLVPQSEFPGSRRAFSLANFIPLLAERIQVISPLTRSYLVSWISVLDSVPDLELVTYLPEFLDGLLKYLSDPIEEVRLATENVLADFLQEIQEITNLQKRKEEKARAVREALSAQNEKAEDSKAAQSGTDADNEQLGRGAFMPDGEAKPAVDAANKALEVDPAHESGAWMPGQGVKVDHAAIVEILIDQLDPSQDEIQQTTALGWISKFLEFAPEVMVPLTPRLIPAILPNLAHHIPAMQSAAAQTNQKLFSLIQSLPSPSVTTAGGVASSSAPSLRNAPSSPVSAVPKLTVAESATPTDNNEKPQTQPTKLRTTTLPVETASIASGSAVESSQGPASRPHSPIPSTSPEDPDPFDYQSTVNGLTIQFLSEHEETRIFALKWLIMLHQKAPKKILSIDDGTFPALLKTLSDTSEEVIKHDLQLLAQISSSSEEGYFKSFVMNLLELFSTDKGLLDSRGSLIIRQLCMSLNTERIYRTFAEILEREEDLEFASVMAQKLSIILITSPELSDFRKRLKNLESRDGQALFTTLYRSWCHNAVSVFSLCLLAQAYEHASNLLAVFGELEITLQLLVQIDKLVQLIESPVFTSLRLQLLEPDRYPYLFKCLYGLLMLLPQSSAFISLSRRLNAVGSMGVQHMPQRTSTVATQVVNRSKVTRDEIKWQELLSHFRSVQAKHEKARRRDLAIEPEFSFIDPNESDRAQGPSARPGMRRKVSAQPSDIPASRQSGALSPLNPRRGLLGSAVTAVAGVGGGR
ncbi:hypothetical protein OPQ81_004706 [Rhizoctonia solani]|nr:hypothetical protein OPQ81_004706 [Rhizoctonia solani]